MIGHMYVTHHALRRYTERIRPGADMREARIVLLDATRRCRPAAERTIFGQKIWLVDNPDMRLVTKHDPVRGMICVTVLGPEEPVFIEEKPTKPPTLIVVATPEPSKPKPRIPAPPTRPKKTAAEKAAAAMENEVRRLANIERRRRHEALMAEHQRQRDARKARAAEMEAARAAKRERQAAAVAAAEVKAARPRPPKLSPCSMCCTMLVHDAKYVLSSLPLPAEDSPWVRRDGTRTCLACAQGLDDVHRELSAMVAA